MSKIMNKVIVWSIDGFNTLALIRQIGQGNADIFFLVKGHAGFAAKSKYCNHYFETDTVEEGYNYLINNYKEEKYKPIIVVSSEDVLIFIDSHKEELEKYFILPICAQRGNVKKYIDKNTMTQLAEEIGIICPKSRPMQWNSSIADIEYPCLMKPSHEKPGHYNEFKYRVCKNEAQLKRTLKYVRHDSEFILQQFIPVKNEILVYGCRMWDGNTVVAGASIKDRSNETGATSHGYVIPQVPNCVDVDKIKEFVDRIDYHGLFSVEYGLFENKAYFFEINLRNDGTSHFFYQAGANLPLAYIYSCAGLDYSLVPTQVKGKCWFIDELYDVENVILGRISKKQYKKDLSEAVSFKYYDTEDMMPYKIAKKERMKQVIQDIVLKKFRLYIVFVLDKVGLRK